MKQKTKNNLITGGLLLGGGVAAIMLMSRSEEAAGGFGGGGGIPLLPGDTEGAAEGDTIINYILPTPEKFEGFGYLESKKTQYAQEFGYPESVMQQAAAGEAIYGTYEGETRFGAADVAEDLAAAGISKKVEVKAQTPKSDEGGAAWYNPFAWNWSKAAENYQAWSTRSTERTLGIEPSKDIRGAVETKKVEAQRVSTSREYSKVAVGGGGGGGTYPTKKGSVGGTSPYRSTTHQRLSSRFSTGGQRGSGY